MQYKYETEIEFNKELCSAIITLDNIEYEHVPGSYSYNAESDVDYWGYTNIDFTISSVEVFLDEQGRSFYTNSKDIINELITDELYASIYDWLLDQVKKESDYD